MKIRRIALFLMALALVALAIAPSFQANAQGKSLQIYIAGPTQDTLDWFNKTAFPAFQKANPDVKLEVISGGWDTFDTKVAGWITSGDGPDIIYLGSEYAATYGKLLANLDDKLKDWPDLKSYLPSAIATVTFDGHLRGLPLLMSPRAMFYRKDLTADPASFKAPATFADSLAFVKANTVVKDNAIQKQAFIDIGNGLFDAQEFIAYIWSAGGELYNADGTSAFDSPQTAEALKYMYDRRRAIMPTEQTAGLPAVQGVPLASGKIVSGIFPMWNVPALDDKLWDNIAIQPYPAGKGGKQLIQVFIDWLSVPAYSKNQDLAVSFLKFIGSKDNAIALSKVAGYTPARSDAWDDIRKGSKVWDQLFTLAEKYGRGFSDIRASADLRPLITEKVNLYLTDQMSLADLQKQLKTEYDAILKKDGYLK